MVQRHQYTHAPFLLLTKEKPAIALQTSKTTTEIPVADDLKNIDMISTKY